MSADRTHYVGDGCPEHPADRLSGDGGFQHGDFAEPRPHGNVHIVQTVTGPTVTMSCGKAWWQTRLRPGNGDWPNQCAACWDTF